MKLKLSVSKERYKDVSKELTSLGIELDDNADLELIERIGSLDYLNVKDEKGDRLRIPISEIVFIESFGRCIDVHTEKETFRTPLRIYALEQELGGKGFLRVSNSCIICKSKIKKIKPALSQKFVLVMLSGSLVDVTRSYYYAFKEQMGI